MLHYQLVSLAGKEKLKNQDACRIELLDGFYFAALADGVSRSDLPEFAATKSCDDFIEQLTKDPGIDLSKVVRKINKDLYEFSLEKSMNHGLASTFTGVRISGNSIEWVHCGDSGILLFRNRKLSRLTIDHSQASLIKDFKSRLIENPALARHKHILYSCLGYPSIPALDTNRSKLVEGDRLIIYSDGFTKLFTDMTLTQYLDENNDFDQVASLINNYIENSILEDDLSYIFMEYRTG